MKDFAVIYGDSKMPLQRKAIEVLCTFLQDYNIEYPVCHKWDNVPSLSNHRLIYIGTAQNNPALAKAFECKLTRPEEYAIKVENDTAYIMGYDDSGVLYGCIDFYNKYILKKDVQVGFIGAIRNYVVNSLPEVGSTIVTKVDILEEIFGMTLANAEIKCNGEVVATAEIKLSVRSVE
jgi:hypothetical protein